KDALPSPTRFFDCRRPVLPDGSGIYGFLVVLFDANLNLRPPRQYRRIPVRAEVEAGSLAKLQDGRSTPQVIASSAFLSLQFKSGVTRGACNVGNLRLD